MPKKGYKDIKEDVILKRTSKTFNEWKKILDKFNVKKMIVENVTESYIHSSNNHSSLIRLPDL
jgi:glucan phosphorylase